MIYSVIIAWRDRLKRGEEWLVKTTEPERRFGKPCRRQHGEIILCTQQAMMLHTLPLVWNEILLRPLPEGTVAEDVVVSIAEINDPEAQHIVWPAEEREGRF